MTDVHATARAERRFRLTTLGSLALAGPEDDTVLGTHGHHRRRLALLAVLASAGARGRTRDQLLLLFWPDATQSRARRSLDQLLYALRSSIDDSVFSSANPVRLDPDVVASDVGAFAAAVERGDLLTAASEYRGPFLDGVYLDDAPEFERWTESERARLATVYADVVERLARAADDARDYQAALRWWRRLTEVDPLSSMNAMGFMRALMNTGDHPAALQHADRFSALVARELNTNVGPAVSALIAEVRAAARVDAPAQPAASAAVGLSPSASRPRLGLRIGALVSIALVVVSAGLLYAAKRVPFAGATAEPSIAVLPFNNISRDVADTPIIEGVGEELTTTLATIPRLRVVPQTSARAIANEHLDARMVASRLGVSHVLEGSVQKQGAQLRVQVRVIRARDGAVVLSRTYQRELKDAFSLQDEIARAVASELNIELNRPGQAPLRRPPTQSIVAWELYSRGVDRRLLRNDSAARQGFEYLRQAVTLDSGFAAAWAGLARMQIRVPGDQPGDFQRVVTLSAEYARKALALDDSLAEAHEVFGGNRMISFDLASARSHLLKAAALDPSRSEPHEMMVTLYLWLEQPLVALEHARMAVAAEPFSAPARAELAHALLELGRCDEALPILEELSRLQPPLLRTPFYLAQCHATENRWTEAIAAIRPLAAHSQRPARGLLGYFLARSGARNEARSIFAALRSLAERGEAVSFDVVWVSCGLGEMDEVFHWLSRAVEEGSLNGSTGMASMTALMGPLFTDIRRDPRFDAFRARLRR